MAFMTSTALIQEKRQACLYGGAIGDAFGYEIEFSSIATIQSRYGKAGLQQPVFHNGKLIVSDDTQMTMFTLEAINACDAQTPITEVVERIRLAYVDWYHTQLKNPETYNYTGTIGRSKVLQVTRAPGNCCMSSMAGGGSGTPETPINDNKGCGGVMRVAPIGLFPEKWDADQAFELAIRAAAITHTHPTGYLSAGSLAAMICFLIQGKEISDAIEQMTSILKNYPRHEETSAKIEQAIKLSSSEMNPLDAIETLGQGWIAEEALGIGLYAALKGENYTEVIQIAANHSGDSDSTASIAGQIYGVWKGAEKIPQEWMEALDINDLFSNLD
jgi:ADP-ribosyl-[dinitrogen reductase] hydrolase